MFAVGLVETGLNYFADQWTYLLNGLIIAALVAVLVWGFRRLYGVANRSISHWWFRRSKKTVERRIYALKNRLQFYEDYKDNPSVGSVRCWPYIFRAVQFLFFNLVILILATAVVLEAELSATGELNTAENVFIGAALGLLLISTYGFQRNIRNGLQVANAVRDFYKFRQNTVDELNYLERRSKELNGE
jgi:hypothetical protein